MTQIASATAADASRNPRAVVGGNNPPPTERLPLHELAKDEFNEAIDKHPDRVRGRINDLCASAGRAVCTTDQEMGRCTHLLKQIYAVERVVEREREMVKAPYREAGTIIDDAARAMLSRLTERRIAVEDMGREYMRAKQKKLDDARIAKAPARKSFSPVKKQRATVKSELGGTASAKALKVANIVDLDLAFGAVKTVPGVIEAIQKAIDALVRVGQSEIPGVDIEDDVGLSVT